MLIGALPAPARSTSIGSCCPIRCSSPMRCFALVGAERALAIAQRGSGRRLELDLPRLGDPIRRVENLE
jgi:hypothetical protein